MLWYDEFWTFKTPITYQKPTWNHSKLLWLEFFGRRWGPLRSRVSLLSHGTLGKCAKCSRSSVTTTGLRWWEGCKRSYLDLPSAWDIRNWLRKKWNIGVRSRLDRLFQVSGGPCFWGKDTACVIVLRNNLITVCPSILQANGIFMWSTVSSTLLKLKSTPMPSEKAGYAGSAWTHLCAVGWTFLRLCRHWLGSGPQVVHFRHGYNDHWPMLRKLEVFQFQWLMIVQVKILIFQNNTTTNAEELPTHLLVFRTLKPIFCPWGHEDVTLIHAICNLDGTCTVFDHQSGGIDQESWAIVIFVGHKKGLRIGRARKSHEKAQRRWNWMDLWSWNMVTICHNHDLYAVGDMESMVKLINVFLVYQSDRVSLIFTTVLCHIK